MKGAHATVASRALGAAFLLATVERDALPERRNSRAGRSHARTSSTRPTLNEEIHPMRTLTIDAMAHAARPTVIRAAGLRQLGRLSMLVISLGVLIGMTSGCAQVMAIRQPASLDRNLLAVGTDRTVVIGVFGAPVSADDRADGGRTEVYRYVDGGTKNSWWSKTGRVVVYTAGDVFTAWLDRDHLDAARTSVPRDRVRVDRRLRPQR